MEEYPFFSLFFDFFVNSILTKVLNMLLEQLYLIVGIPNKSINIQLYRQRDDLKGNQ